MAFSWFHRIKNKPDRNTVGVVLFGRSNTINLPRLKVNDRPIHWSKQANYLGVTTGRKLNFGQHITNITKKAARNRGMLYPILNKKSPFPIQTRHT